VSVIALAGEEFIMTNAIETGDRFFRLAQQFDFYGRPIRVLKLFGQTRWGDTSPGRVSGGKIFHSAGVVVDRRTNHIYVADTGNNRILGFRSYASTNADLVFGQPDEFSGAANGDGNLGFHGPTTRTNLCLLNYPENPNVAEQWMRLNFDVDAVGNLYVPDLYNNRVLIYYVPFSADTSGGQGDNVPDLVLGQDNWTSNQINHGLGPSVRDVRSLFISWGNPYGFDHVSARGVSVDTNGNVWYSTNSRRMIWWIPTSRPIAIGMACSGFMRRTRARYC
jgi:hypothetical protein